MVRSIQVQDTQMQECIDNCMECAAVCRTTIQHCLRQGGKLAAQPYIRLMADCAEICQTSANFMLRESDMHAHTCKACADVCERCARECQSMRENSLVSRCAEACQRCADSCRRMSNVPA